MATPSYHRSVHRQEGDGVKGWCWLARVPISSGEVFGTETPKYLATREYMTLYECPTLPWALVYRVLERALYRLPASLYQGNTALMDRTWDDDDQKQLSRLSQAHPKVPEDEIKRLYAIMITFPIRAAEDAYGFYQNMAMVNHSCDPNCVPVRDGSSRVSLKALRDIVEGEEITFAYSGVIPAPDSDYRECRDIQRRTLFLDCGFVCQCPLCLKEYK